METRTKYLFITGGVLSGVGKGVVAASVGALLRARGYKVLMQKLDPYLNQDPGTMSPYQHGEVYVTKDSKETDLDLGHYERFVGEECVSESNYTTGAIYKEIFRKERKGEYKGQTVQVFPHVLEAITRKIERASTKYKPDFMLIEVGGTVGDIESQPFVYAIASFAKKHKRTFFIHTTYVPYLSVTSEHKTKPTQHSVQLLRSYGVQPTAIIVRSPKRLLAKTRVKIAQYTSLEKEAVVDLPDVQSIYVVPLLLEETRIVRLIEKYFLIKNPATANLTAWRKMTDLVKNTGKNDRMVVIGMVGKYAEFPDAYLSIVESLKIAALYKRTNVEYRWVKAAGLRNDNLRRQLQDCDGIVILPGFGNRGFNGKVRAAHFGRNNGVPTLGICYGMQAMVVQQAQVKKIVNACSSEHKKDGAFVVDIVRGKKFTDNIGGTLRLGEWTAKLKPHSRIRKIYKKELIRERHRHRYEINPAFVNNLEDKDFVFSAFNPDTNLAEAVEVKKHPFYIGVQFHPEFKTTVANSNRLFDEFLRVAIKHSTTQSKLKTKPPLKTNGNNKVLKANKVKRKP